MKNNKNKKTNITIFNINHIHNPEYYEITTNKMKFCFLRFNFENKFDYLWYSG